MKCPFCSENRDRVVDSRESRDGATIRRRRECVSCGRRFTSYEQIDDIPYMVVKHDGSREEFSRKKLLSGLLKACEKRPVATRSLEAIVDEAETMLHDREEREISTHDIGACVMEKLRELDQVAYVRFASVYRRFEDLDAFMDVVKSLLQPVAGMAEAAVPAGAAASVVRIAGETGAGKPPESR
jgi:transcriptional repressor NrdR